MLADSARNGFPFMLTQQMQLHTCGDIIVMINLTVFVPAGGRERISNVFYSCRYVRCLGAVYLRLVGETLEVYNYLEPLYNDYRKIKRKNRNGGMY